MIKALATFFMRWRTYCIVGVTFSTHTFPAFYQNALIPQRLIPPPFHSPQKICLKKYHAGLDAVLPTKTVLRIRIYYRTYYADPDPGSKKCPYGSGSGS